MYLQVASDTERDALDAQKSLLYLHMEALLDGEQTLEQSALDTAAADAIGAAGDDSILEERLFQLAATLDLAAVDARLDELVASAANVLTGPVRTEFLVTYFGFPFFDTLTYPVVRWKDIEELREVKVVRLSPDDANAIRPGAADDVLRGGRLYAFGAFFSRSYRENDYLWGRLHGADRLVDVVLSSVAENLPEGAIDAAQFKRRLSLAILDRESGHLANTVDEITRIRRELRDV